MVGGVSSVRAAGRTPPEKLARFSLLLMAAGPLIMIVPGLAGIETAPLVIAMMFVHFIGIGAIMPSMNAAAMSAVSVNVGAASSLLSMLQTIAAVIATIVVSSLQIALPVYGLPIVMLAFTFAAAAVLWRAAVTRPLALPQPAQLQQTPAKF